MKKKLLASFLALVMVLGLLPTAAFAADPAGLEVTGINFKASSTAAGVPGDSAAPNTMWIELSAAVTIPEEQEKYSVGLNPGSTETTLTDVNWNTEGDIIYWSFDDGAVDDVSLAAGEYTATLYYTDIDKAPVDSAQTITLETVTIDMDGGTLEESDALSHGLTATSGNYTFLATSADADALDLEDLGLDDLTPSKDDVEGSLTIEGGSIKASYGSDPSSGTKYKLKFEVDGTIGTSSDDCIVTPPAEPNPEADEDRNPYWSLSEDDDVSFTVTPLNNKEYTMVLESSEQSVTCTPASRTGTSATEYTLTMPGADVTVKITLADPGPTGPTQYTLNVTHNAGGIVKYGYDGWNVLASGESATIEVAANVAARLSIGAKANSGQKIESFTINDEDVTASLGYESDGQCDATVINLDPDVPVIDVVVTFAPSGNSTTTDNNNTSSSDDSSSGSSSSAGGGSSSTVGEASTSGGSTTVEMTTSSTTTGSTAKADVKAADMNKAVDSAIAEAAKRDTAPVVEIEVKTSSRADSLNVSLPTASLETLAKTNDSTLVISSDVATVALDHTALSALANQAGSTTVSLQVAPVEGYALNSAQQQIVGSASVVDLSLVSGRTAIHDYNSGTITVTLPYELPSGVSARDVVVYYMDDNGALTPCSTSYSGGKVTFTTSHLSKYVIADKELGEAAKPISVSPTNDKLEVDGASKTPAAYKINDYNYFKLRDIAALLNGTDKQFSVDYESSTGEVTMTSGQPYAVTSDDLTSLPAGNRQATASTNVIYINGTRMQLNIYLIDGYNYFKLRDLASALDFSVGWTAERGMFLESDKPYTA